MPAARRDMAVSRRSTTAAWHLPAGAQYSPVTMTQDPQDRSRRPALHGAGVPLLTLCLLGGFRAGRGEAGPVVERWRRPGARTVVKMLALAPGHRLHRDQVTEACWPDVDLNTARRSLRVSLHTARHTLEPELAPRGVSAYLATDGDLLSLVPGAVEVDVVAAERALSRHSTPESRTPSPPPGPRSVRNCSRRTGTRPGRTPGGVNSPRCGAASPSRSPTSPAQRTARSRRSGSWSARWPPTSSTRLSTGA